MNSPLIVVMRTTQLSVDSFYTKVYFHSACGSQPLAHIDDLIRLPNTPVQFFFNHITDKVRMSPPPQNFSCSIDETLGTMAFAWGIVRVIKIRVALTL